MKNNHEQAGLNSLAEILSKAASFFSVTYAIILTLSISYNVGYFKEINPQIVDLMGLGDYIDDTIHNLWFFLLAALLSFSSSLAFLRIKRNIEFYKLIVFGSFALIMSSYFLLKDVYYSKLWPTIKKLLINESITLYMWLIAILILTLIFLIYYSVTRLTKHNLDPASLGVIPIIIFFIIVIMPYLGGLIHGYIEIKEVQKKEFFAYSVKITLVNDEVMKNVFISKKLDKGILIRQFKEEDNDSKFLFISWGAVKHITYYNMMD
jgi:hypothetical protein